MAQRRFVSLYDEVQGLEKERDALQARLGTRTLGGSGGGAPPLSPAVHGPGGPGAGGEELGEEERGETPDMRADRFEAEVDRLAAEVEDLKHASADHHAAAAEAGARETQVYA